MNFAESCMSARREVKTAAALVHELHRHDAFARSGPTVPEPNDSEMHANINLAYRHLEDAAMRLGKAIQAFAGGESIYDK